MHHYIIVGSCACIIIIYYYFYEGTERRDGVYMQQNYQQPQVGHTLLLGVYSVYFEYGCDKINAVCVYNENVYYHEYRKKIEIISSSSAAAAAAAVVQSVLESLASEQQIVCFTHSDVLLAAC